MKRRHVYTPPKGSRFGRSLFAIVGGIMCAMFVFYFIPLLKRLEAGFGEKEEIAQIEDPYIAPPEEFVQEEEIPEEEEEPEEPEDLSEDDNSDLDLSPLDVEIGKAGTGGKPLLLPSKFKISSDQLSSFESNLDTPPKVRSTFAPKYPKKLKSKKIQGRVIVSGTVDESGTVVETGIKKSSGYKEFDEAAMKAVLRWKFTPGKRGDQKVKAKIVQPISFKLN